MFEFVNVVILISVFVMVIVVSVAARKFSFFNGASRVIVSACVAALSCVGLAEICSGGAWKALLIPYTALAIAIAIMLLMLLGAKLFKLCRGSSEAKRRRSITVRTTQDAPARSRSHSVDRVARAATNDVPHWQGNLEAEPLEEDDDQERGNRITSGR